jgi:hypothetical protein
MKGYALDWEKYMIGPGPSIFLGGVPALVNLQIPLLRRADHDLKAIFDARGSLEILKDKSIVYVSSKAKPKSDVSTLEFFFISSRCLADLFLYHFYETKHSGTRPSSRFCVRVGRRGCVLRRPKR